MTGGIWYHRPTPIKGSERRKRITGNITRFLPESQLILQIFLKNFLQNVVLSHNRLCSLPIITILGSDNLRSSSSSRTP
jgi:hypothetical protein